MTLLVVLIVGAVASLCWVGQTFAGKKDLLDSLNVSVLVGLMSVGAIAYVVNPSLVTEVSLVPYYSPHAYNLIIWPGFGLILRRMFPAKAVLPTLVFAYCVDEILWNGLAAAYFWPNMDVLGYVLLPSWHAFIAVLVAAGAVCYLVVRPKISVNVMWAVLAAFGFFWAWVAGFPVLAVTNIASLSFEQTLYRLSFEVMWQVVILAWAYATLKPRAAQTMPPIPRPFVG